MYIYIHTRMSLFPEAIVTLTKPYKYPGSCTGRLEAAGRFVHEASEVFAKPAGRIHRALPELPRKLEPRGLKGADKNFVHRLPCYISA